MSRYTTTAAYVSGALCGRLWMPAVIGGLPYSRDVRGLFARMAPKGATFRDALLSLLAADGGDFQGARFTGDTILRIERRTHGDGGRYSVHVRERPLAELRGCADLVDPDQSAADFMGED